MIIGSYCQCCFLLILSTFLEKVSVLRLKKILEKFASLIQISKKIIFLEKMMLKLGIYDMKLYSKCMFFLSVIIYYVPRFLPKMLTACIIIASFIIFFWENYVLKLHRKCDLCCPTVGSILAERCHIFKFCKKCLKADEIRF